MGVKQVFHAEYKALLEEYKRRKIDLQTVSEDVIKADIIRRVIYRKADFIAQGTKLVGVEEFNVLDVKWQFPSYMEIAYPVAEGARAPREKITWTDFAMSLEKAEGSFWITDEAVIRGMEGVQYRTGVRRLAEAFALKKDDNIVGTLLAGKGNDVACAATWDVATVAQITGDIQEAIEIIVGAEGVTHEDISRIALVLPIAAWTPLLKLQEIENIRMSLGDWLTRTYGMTLHPTKNKELKDGRYGLALIKGPDTAIHGVLRPPAGIPLTEIKRIPAVGKEHIVRQFFATKVVPDSADVKTSTRIVRFTGILP